MNLKIPKKRILIAISPLLIFVLVLVADLVFVRDSVWSQIHDPYEWNKDERLYTAKKSQEIKSGDRFLFGYEGEDANCWNKEKDWQIKECLAKHPYGGQGTLIMGGNLVVNGAEALYINKYDRAGKNWIMSTTSEPWGNALGTSYGTSTDVMFGNNLLADGTIRSGAINFKAASSSVVFRNKSEFYTSDGLACEAKTVSFENYNVDKSIDGLKTVDQNVCGVCDGGCGYGKTGYEYRFISTGGLDVKENIKVNDKIRLCAPGTIHDCENACCRLPEYREDDTWDNFVGNDCEATGCITDVPPDSCFMVKPAEECKYCYPQPYPHYYRQEKPPLETEYKQIDGVDGFWFNYEPGDTRPNSTDPSGQYFDGVDDPAYDAEPPVADNGQNGESAGTYTSYGVRNGGRQAWRVPKKGPALGTSVKVVFSSGYTVTVPDTSHNFRVSSGEGRGFVFKPGLGPNGTGDSNTGTAHGGIYLHAPYGDSSKSVTFYYQ